MLQNYLHSVLKKLSQFSKHMLQRQFRNHVMARQMFNEMCFDIVFRLSMEHDMFTDLAEFVFQNSLNNCVVTFVWEARLNTGPILPPKHIIVVITLILLHQTIETVPTLITFVPSVSLIAFNFHLKKLVVSVRIIRT